LFSVSEVVGFSFLIQFRPNLGGVFFWRRTKGGQNVPTPFLLLFVREFSCLAVDAGGILEQFSK
jgi:hypothetical protein